MSEAEVCVVFVTAPTQEEATSLGQALVRDRLAACVNVVGPIRSIYEWEGEIRDDAEWLMIVKTTRERFTSLRQFVEARHSYEVPEILALPVTSGSSRYLEWVIQLTGRPTS